MSNPHPTPRPENLRPPWQPGTSGNPAGYSRGRRISDAIEAVIDELSLEPDMARVVVGMALGRKDLLKHKETDPETGIVTWEQHKPDLAWFKVLMSRLEPPPEKPDDMAVLECLRILDEEYPYPDDPMRPRERPKRPEDEKPFHVRQPSGVWQPPGCDFGENWTYQPPQSEPGGADSGPAQVPCSVLERFHPVRYAFQLLAYLEAQLAGLFTWGRLRGALGQIAVIAAFLLLHQVLVLDHPPAGGQAARQGTVVADEQQGPEIQVVGRLVHDQIPRDPAAVEDAVQQAGARPEIVAAGSAFPGLFPVLSLEKPPDRRATNAGLEHEVLDTMRTTDMFPTGSPEARLLDLLERSRNDPCYFNERVLCRSPYWRAQREWAAALVRLSHRRGRDRQCAGEGLPHRGTGPVVLVDTTG